MNQQRQINGIVEHVIAKPTPISQKYLMLVRVNGFGRRLRKIFLSRLRNKIKIMGLVVCYNISDISAIL